MDSLQQASVEKSFNKVETDCLSVKEKLPDDIVCDKSHADSFMGHERFIIMDFLEEGTTVDNAFYCQLFRQYSPYLLNNPFVYIFDTKNKRRNKNH